MLLQTFLAIDNATAFYKNLTNLIRYDSLVTGSIEVDIIVETNNNSWDITK
jgi:hypothetical protein